jgi:CysZ protein
MLPINSLFHSFKLLFAPGLRWLTLGPIAINLVIYLLLGWYFIELFSQALDWSLNRIPDWLSFIKPLAWIVFTLVLLIGFGYTFALLAAVIASPFNGLLAEKIARQRGLALDDTPLNARAIISLAGRSLWRELVKLAYFLPRLLGVLLLSALLGLIPLVGWLAGMLFTLLWASWNMAIQFIDYPADNQGLNFSQTIDVMRKKRGRCLGFGAIIAGLLSIPLFNLFVLPAAVIAATLLWADELY